MKQRDPRSWNQRNKTLVVKKSEKLTNGPFFFNVAAEDIFSDVA